MGNFRFRRIERLRGRGAFDQVFQRGRWAVGRSLKTIVCMKAEAGPLCRLGVVVPASYGGAVHRNRFKRLVREVFRLHKQELIPGLDIVVMSKRGASQPGDYWQVESELLGLWRQMGYVRI